MTPEEYPYPRLGDNFRPTGGIEERYLREVIVADRKATYPMPANGMLRVFITQSHSDKKRRKRTHE